LGELGQVSDQHPDLRPSTRRRASRQTAERRTCSRGWPSSVASVANARSYMSKDPDHRRAAN
jgi:hypothetical protein